MRIKDSQGRFAEVISVSLSSGIYSGGSSSDSIFRATKIASDHLALAGRDLTPLDPQPPLGPASGSNL